MFSLNKKDDQELLLEIAETIEHLVTVGTKEAIDIAEGFGLVYLDLDNKLKTHDYSKEDEITFRVKERFKHENYPSLHNN